MMSVSFWERWPRKYYVIGMIAGVMSLMLLVGIGWWLWRPSSGIGTPSVVSEISSVSDTVVSSMSEQQSELAQLYVDVKGAVKHPNVYALPVGSRVFDAVAAAGGLADNAAEDALNKAQLLTDQMVLYVYTKEEWQARGSQDSTYMPQSMEPDTSSTTATMINVNTADALTLQQLPGVGAKKAEAIIAYRTQNGSFHSVEELKQVKGIGNKLFEQIAPMVTIK